MKEFDIGKIIKEGRSKKGWSQKQLAEIFGVKSATVSHWEKNIRVPPGDVLLKLFDVLESDYKNKSESLEDRVKILEDEMKHVKNVLLGIKFISSEK